jgi:hypothetical protein
MRKSLVDDTPPRPLLTTPDPYAAAICARRAPRCIFAGGADGKTTFSEIDVEKGTLKQLFSLPLRFELGFNWAVSPDGRSLAYVERSSGGMRIAIRDLDSLGSMRASLPVEGNGMLRSVVWDADGRGGPPPDRIPQPPPPMDLGTLAAAARSLTLPVKPTFLGDGAFGGPGSSRTE